MEALATEESKKCVGQSGHSSAAGAEAEVPVSEYFKLVSQWCNFVHSYAFLKV